MAAADAPPQKRHAQTSHAYEEDDTVSAVFSHLKGTATASKRTPLAPEVSRTASSVPATRSQSPRTLSRPPVARPVSPSIVRRATTPTELRRPTSPSQMRRAITPTEQRRTLSVEIQRRATTPISASPSRNSNDSSWRLTLSEIAGQRLYSLAQATRERRAMERATEHSASPAPSISDRSRALAQDRFGTLQDDSASRTTYNELLYKEAKYVCKYFSFFFSRFSALFCIVVFLL